MSGSALEAYLADVEARADNDPRAEPIVRALDRVIVSTRPDFEIAVKYKILMYALRGDLANLGLRNQCDQEGRISPVPVRRSPRRPEGRPARGQLGPQDVGLRL